MNPSSLKSAVTFKKRRIINILFITAVILVVVNLLLEKFFLINYVEKEELNETEIENKFLNAVFNFGLEKNWVSKRDPGADKPYHLLYRVELPSDLPVALILKELKDLFDNGFVSIESEEKKINGKTLLKISTDNELKLAAEFRYNINLKRKAGTISFLLLDITKLNEGEDSVLLSSPEPFGLILVPSKEAAKEAVKISRSGKNYALLLNDEIPEPRYNFKESYSEARLKASVREIIADFPELKFILIDEKSALFSSPVFTFIEHEFIKRKLKIFKKNSLDLLTEPEIIEPVGAFKKIADEKNRRTILTTVQNFFLLQPEITRYKKIGCRFVAPPLF